MRRERNYQSTKKWILPEPLASGSFDVLTRLLLRRGYEAEETRKEFLNPDYYKLSDPFEIPDMKEAVNTIKTAIEAGDKIAVYGDYDVDGVTATALLTETLGILGADCISYIPSRNDEGYGLNNEAIDSLVAEKVKLVVTVDCGSTSFDEIKHANAAGLTVVVTDHHTMKLKSSKIAVPEAAAVVNPKRLPEASPLYELAGVAVAFYLVRALQTHFPVKLPRGHEKWLLDLVALGTICDIVPLTGENRILAHFGLKVLTQTRRVGIRALAAVAEVQVGLIDSYKVGFLLGPRLNAAGRLEHAETSLKLLLTQDEDEAAELAHHLNAVNLERQELTERIVEEAKTLIEQDGNKKSIYLLAKNDWPAGVVGIVAARLVEEYGKPMLVMEDLGEELKGSARSISELNIIEALTDSGELLSHFGGHAYAAGFKLSKDKFILLEDRLIKFTDQKVIEKELIPSIEIDEIAALDELDTDLVKNFEKLQPFGRDNRKPIIAVMDVTLADCRLVGNPAVHLKLSATQSDTNLAGMAFGWGEVCDLDFEKNYDLAVTLELNTWRDKQTPEFRLIDIKPHE